MQPNVVAEVWIIDDQWLGIRFADGLEGAVHYDRTHLRELAGSEAHAQFRQARMTAGTVTWPCGVALDAEVARLKIEETGRWSGYERGL